MSQLLEELLQRCTVKLRVPGQMGWGTGFFVAPGWILTCAHVVKSVQDSGLYIPARDFLGMYAVVRTQVATNPLSSEFPISLKTYKVYEYLLKKVYHEG